MDNDPKCYRGCKDCPPKGCGPNWHLILVMLGTIGFWVLLGFLIKGCAS